ncbi:hypothetical protein BJF85_17720 [Saccharomonospora sp. CUA-673]|uniref:PH domain-containing protein n=1 Tax=Saccharomonospora sp. CUA-673 TaxID=1904969 RepID=UPI0009672BDA|nr:PH domain-containing protein [Saccharomonospora sp. CUA-673]OLT46251.1 hypothetical protein BJF85_17720 [Saccharomonospora sp. CUA-673]
MADESGQTQEQPVTDRRDEQDEPVVRKQRRAVFRIPLASLITLPLLLFCITPLAFTAPGMQALYLLPVALTVWVVRVRTVVTPEGMWAYTLTSSRHIPWDELSSLAVTKKARIRAVVTGASGEETVSLPHARLHHVPVLSLLSNGRVPDPSGALSTDGGTDSDSDSEAKDVARPTSPA